MTGKELAAVIGKPGTLRADSLRVSVTIVDARMVFGRLDYRVTPVRGDGERWVSADRVEVTS